MPHVVVKRWPGKSKRHKARLSVAIVKDVMNVLNYGEESVSVAGLIFDESGERLTPTHAVKKGTRLPQGTCCCRANVPQSSPRGLGEHGRVRFVIALRSNDSAMRFRLLKAIQSGL